MATVEQQPTTSTLEVSKLQPRTAPVKTDTPYKNESLGDSGLNFAGEVVKGVTKPFVQMGLQLAVPVSAIFNGGKPQARFKSDFYGGDDGYIYDYVTSAGMAGRNARRRVDAGKVSFARGLIGAVAEGGIEPGIDIATTFAGGSFVKNIAETGVRQTFKSVVSQGLKQSLFRGGAIAGAYDLTSQAKGVEDYNIFRTVGAVAAGTALDFGVTRALPALPWVIGKGGQLIERSVPQSVKNNLSIQGRKILDSKAGQFSAAIFENKKSLLKRKFGETGEQVANMYQKAYDKMNNEVGKFHLGLIDRGIVKPPVGTTSKFTPQLKRWQDPEFRFDVRDALGMRGKFSDPKTYESELAKDPELKSIVEFFDGYRKDKGLLGQQMGIVDNLQDIDTYFSSYTPQVELKKSLWNKIQQATTDEEKVALFEKNSQVVNEMIEYGVSREGKWQSKLEAFQTYYDAMDVALETNRISDDANNSYFNWLVRNEHAESIAQARKNFIGDLDSRTKTLTPRASSFDYEKKTPMPWNDPDPVRVMTKYIEDANKRIAYAEQFGNDDEVIKKMIQGVVNSKGKKQAEELADIFKRMTGQVDRSPAIDKITSMMTNVETVKLYAAALLNIPQTLLYIIPTDFGSFGAGLRSVFGNKAIRESIERGIYVSDLARQTRAMTSWNQKLADNVLKYSGFSYLDMTVKSMGAGVADAWVNKSVQSLEKYIGQEITPEARKVIAKGFLKDRAVQKNILREGYRIQKESAKEFNAKFAGEDFKAVAGEIGRAQSYLDSLDSSYSREAAKQQQAADALEKSLMLEGKQFVSTDEEVKAIADEIDSLRASINIYEGQGELAVPEGEVEMFSQRQIDDALAESKRLLIDKMKTRVEELTDKFDNVRSLGMNDGVVMGKAKKKSTSGGQKVASIADELGQVRASIAESFNKYSEKKQLLENIIDSYKIAEDSILSKNPDVVARRNLVEEKKSLLAQANISQYKEYHYLKELGLNPEEILARGHLTSEDLTTATQNLVEQTQGSANPLMTPLFAESSAGKVFYQFKKIVLQQSNFMLRQVKRNFISKDTASRGNAIKFLTVTFALYPPAMGAIRDLRDMATGKKSPDEAFQFDEYWNSMNLIAASGIFMDFANSFDNNRIHEFFTPPVVSDGFNYIQAIYNTGSGAAGLDADKTEKGFKQLYEQMVRQTGIGSILLNYTKK